MLQMQKKSLKLFVKAGGQADVKADISLEKGEKYGPICYRTREKNSGILSKKVTGPCEVKYCCITNLLDRFSRKQVLYHTQKKNIPQQIRSHGTHRI